MSRKVLVQAIQPDPPDGPVYGQVSNPADFQKAQIYSHGHTEEMARYFVVGKCAVNGVAGFDYTLLGGMQIRVLAGVVVGVDGKGYGLIGSENVDLTLGAADEVQPRIDLIVATLEADVDAADELRPFVRLRTQTELDDAVAPYPPQQFNQPTEQHTRVTIEVKAGTPAAQPVAPTIDPDEEPLYAIRIPASATQIDGAGVIDLRNLIPSNCELADIIENLPFPTIPKRWVADVIDLAPGSLGYKTFGATDQDAWDNLALRFDPDPSPGGGGSGPALRPEILRPDVVPYHAESGKLTSSGAVSSGTPIVRIPYPRQVAFATGVFSMDPNAFLDQGLNPRLLNTDPDSGTNSVEHVVDYSLGSIQVINTDGGGAWTLQGFELPQNRARNYAGQRLAAARDSRDIEVMGGAPLGGDSAWYTVDTLNGTVAQRALTGDIPFFAIRGVFPCGDGVNVIVAEQTGADGGFNGSKLNWYKVNCISGASVRIIDAPGSSEEDAPISGYISAVVGDLISPGIIFLLINVSGVDGVSAGNGKAWIYHCDSSTFEMIAPTGQNPLTTGGLELANILQDVDVCMYQSGQAVLVRGIGVATWVFDYPTRSWKKLNIIQPNGDLHSWSGDRLWGLTLANINGRVQLTSEASSIWELTPGETPQWNNLGLPAGMGTDNPGVSFNLPVPGTSGRGFPGLIGMISDGLPRGTGWLLAGRISNAPKRDIWKFAAGGIVETIFEGETALTLGAGTKSATFRVSNFQIPWLVERMLITLKGANLQGRVKISESFDDGAHFQEIPINTKTEIADSNSNPNRQLLITLIGTGAIKPILRQSHETFEQEGGGGLGMVYLVYDCPAGVTYLYMNDKGQISSEAGAVQTTKSKAILLRATKDGGDPPIVFDFLNKPWFGKKYDGGAKSGGVDPVFPNDLAVLPSNIECWKVAADGTVHLLADCTVVFNGNNTVTGLANGESYRVHLAG